MDEGENAFDRTAQDTISLLEARLNRIEHVLYGPSDLAHAALAVPVTASLADLEKRLATLLRQFRVYTDILKIYCAHPALFQPPETRADALPTDLSPESARAVVLSYAAAFPSTASALAAATSDEPVPEPGLSAALVALRPRMRGLEAAQLAQDADIAHLRACSERVLRRFYAARVLGYGRFVADVEARVERAETAVRRAERGREREKETFGA